MTDTMINATDYNTPKMEYVNGELLYQAGTVPDVERLKLISLLIREMDNPDNTDNISDGYHTFEELYYQRMMLTKTVALAAINKFDEDTVYRSRLHSDGTMFTDYFIVGVTTPQGNYTYHYHKDEWDRFNVKEIDKAPEWDGHTASDITRLYSLLCG